MKADVKPADEREKEALKWAMNFFRISSADLRRGANFKREQEVRLKWALEVYDMELNAAKTVLSDLIAHDIKFAREGHPGALRHLCSLAAALLKRSDPLPEALRDFIVEFLQNPNKKTKQPERFYDLLDRDERIGLAIVAIRKTWNFKATRNAATEGASAASIVREALERGAGIPLGEKAVNKIWETSLGARLARSEEESLQRGILAGKYPADKSWAEILLEIATVVGGLSHRVLPSG
jgi:hypothetical protein